MPASLLSTLVLISERPPGAVFPKSEQCPPPAKLFAGLIIEGVHLMGAWGNQVEASLLKAGGEGVDVVNLELDLDFAVSSHRASIKKVSREKLPTAPNRS